MSTPTLTPPAPLQPGSASPRRARGYVGGSGARYWPSQDATTTTRATVAVVPGRGETPAMFEDVAFRLSLDGFEVTLLGPGEGTDAAIGELRVPGVPLVVVGSDTGALRALVAAGSPALRPDALVLLGLPMLYRAVDGELPTDPPPRALPDLPILLVHGVADDVSPLHLVQMATRTAPRARLDVVPGGHRVLAGPGGRSVAARTLLFVEALPAAAASGAPTGRDGNGWDGDGRDGDGQYAAAGA